MIITLHQMNKALPCTILTEYDITLMQAGMHCRLYQKFGSHPAEIDGKKGVTFAVYAPAAKRVSVIGDFNRWQAGIHVLFPKWDQSGVWEGFIPDVHPGIHYKYQIEAHNGWTGSKADPYGRLHEHPPMSATQIWRDQYKWNDEAWMNSRHAHNKIGVPVSIYEMHFASWKRHGDGRPFSYREMADQLPAYLNAMGFTHVEFMPLMEHPYDPSWGYQITGFFAPTSRFGSPDDLRFLVDELHKHNLGVIFDWVPSHFPTDGHGLGFFDGSHVYEHPDPRKGYHPDWQSLIFNYGRNEVKSFLLSNALFWMDEFHADGLRVDAVASMIYLDYSRKEGEWEPNQSGGREYIEAIELLKSVNTTVYQYHPDVLMIAEESTAFPGVSHPTYAGGLGFGMKWMMGWMHDTLNYFKLDPFFRKFYQDKFSFSMMYYYDENFMLPLSHDEVVHGKSPMIYKMPGDDWQKFANLRSLYTYMWTHPGGHLLFMGNEFGQTTEWNYQSELDWQLLEHTSHKGLQLCVKDLNTLLRSNPALYKNQFDIHGFQWIDLYHRDECVIVYRRKGKKEEDDLLIILNLTPEPRLDWEIYLTEGTYTSEIFNSDAEKYWGSGNVYNPAIRQEVVNKDEKKYKIIVNIPPLAGIVLK